MPGRGIEEMISIANYWGLVSDNSESKLNWLKLLQRNQLTNPVRTLIKASLFPVDQWYKGNFHRENN